MKKKIKWATIKIPSEAYENALRIVAAASAHGWQSFSIQRRDPPTIGAVVTEALKRLGGS